MLDAFVQQLLAIMLSVLQPGQTMYSQIPIDYCDDNCQKTPLCDGSDWKCKPPRYDSVIYEDTVEKLVARGYSLEEASVKAKPLSYTRPETYKEGLVRYVVIAKSVADASLNATAGLCSNKCSSLDDLSQKVCRDSCALTAIWSGDRNDLALAMLTVTKYESGWRADVHGGVTPAGRGDCNFRYPDGRWARPRAKGASLVRGTCRSVCLGQINLGKGYVTYMRKAYRANDLVGIDYASTSRCMSIVARNLSSSRSFCSSWYSGNHSNWAGAMFSKYGSGNSCDVPRLLGRSNTFRYFKLNMSATLDPNVLATLSDPKFDAALNNLLTSTKQITWMYPLNAPSVQEQSAEIAEE
jgi:hypothetical protein